MNDNAQTRGSGQMPFFSLLFILAASSGFTAENPARLLTKAAEVRSLSPAEAEQQRPVKLRGVVTFFDETLFSRFVQDETAGIYLLELTNAPAVSLGQMVEVEGVTGPGEYAPVILPTSIRVVGGAEFPAAMPVTLEELVSGRHDSQLVEFSGLVRAVHFEQESGYYSIDFAKGDERFTVYAKQLPVEQPLDLVESTVKVRGVCATMFNRHRQLFGIRLLVPKEDGVVIENPASSDPFNQPVHKISSLLQFAPEGTLSGRVKVAGTVVFCEPGSAIFIQGDTAGLYCQTMQRDMVQPGDQVEILGFPAKGDYSPVLKDAIHRQIGTGPKPAADAVDVNEILTGVRDCQLVQLPARVLGSVERGLNRFLLLQSGGFTFQAYLPRIFNESELAKLQPGSEVMATGICMIERGNQWQAGNEWRAASFHLLLRSPEDVIVLKAPGGRALPDSTWVAVGCGIVALGSLVWVAVLRRGLLTQSQLIQRK